jgi:hypothetical protein
VSSMGSATAPRRARTHLSTITCRIKGESSFPASSTDARIAPWLREKRQTLFCLFFIESLHLGL